VYITICDFRIEGDAEAFDAWFLARAAILRQLPGNVRYELLRDVTHPDRRTVNEVWETMDDHLAHLVHPVHVEIIAFGSDYGMRDLCVHHWERAEGHISQARERTEQRRDDPDERPEMYQMIDELRTEHSSSAVGGADRS
jgi:quinol monooxygenase YgiN